MLWSPCQWLMAMCVIGLSVSSATFATSRSPWMARPAASNTSTPVFPMTTVVLVITGERYEMGRSPTQTPLASSRHCMSKGSAARDSAAAKSESAAAVTASAPRRRRDKVVDATRSPSLRKPWRSMLRAAARAARGDAMGRRPGTAGRAGGAGCPLRTSSRSRDGSRRCPACRRRCRGRPTSCDSSGGRRSSR